MKLMNKVIFVSLLSLQGILVSLDASSALAMTISTDCASPESLSPVRSLSGRLLFGSGRRSAFTSVTPRSSITTVFAVESSPLEENLTTPERLFPGREGFFKIGAYKVTSTDPLQDCLAVPTCFGDLGDRFASQIDLMISEIIELMNVIDLSISHNLNQYLSDSLANLEIDECPKHICIMAITKLYASIEAHNTTSEQFKNNKKLLYEYGDEEQYNLYNYLVGQCERANNALESQDIEFYYDVVGEIGLHLAFLFNQKPLVFYDLKVVVQKIKTDNLFEFLSDDFWTGLKNLCF